MSDEMSCERERELAAELAIGIVDGHDRDAALRHAASCPQCQSLIADLSRTVDDLLLLAPEHEPPLGFRSRTVDRIVGHRRVFARVPRIAPDRAPRRRRATALAVAAALVVAIAAGSVTTYVATAADRRLADSYRAVLAEGHGSYFAAAPVRGPAGTVGTVYGYQGSPSWLFATVNLPASDRQRFQVLITTRDGQRLLVGSVILGGSANTWGAGLPVDLADVTQLRFAAADERSGLVAYINAQDPWHPR